MDAVAALPPGESTRERPTHFHTLIGTLNHIYLVDLRWQAHLEGRDHDFESLSLVLHEELPVLQRAQQSINHWYVDWSDRQSVQTLDEMVRLRFVGGEHGKMSRGDILLHVVNHATCHRGWIAEMFFEVPARNPKTDLSVYLAGLALPAQVLGAP